MRRARCDWKSRPAGKKRGIACRSRDRRRWRKQAAWRARSGLAAGGDGPLGASHRESSERLPSRHDARVVRSGRHALFLLAYPGEPEPRRAGNYRLKAAGQETKRRIEKFLEKKRNDGVGMAGARRIPVYRKWVPVRRKDRQRRSFSGGRCPRAQVKVFDRRWHRDRLFAERKVLPMPCWKMPTVRNCVRSGGSWGHTG